MRNNRFLDGYEHLGLEAVSSLGRGLKDATIERLKIDNLHKFDRKGLKKLRETLTHNWNQSSLFFLMIMSSLNRVRSLQ